jgi:predicted P-loop ATPase/GTPase
MNILGGDSIGHLNVCLFLKGYRDTAVGISTHNPVTFLFVQLDEGRILQKESGYTTRIARSHFGCCCPHKET